MTTSGDNRNDHGTGIGIRQPGRMATPRQGPPPPPPPPLPPAPPRRVPSPAAPRVGTTAGRSTGGRASRAHARRLARVALATVVAAIGIAGGTHLLLRRDDAPADVASAAAAQEPVAAACGAQPPQLRRSRLSLSRPRLTVPPRRDLSAIIHTSCGDFKVDLLEEEAPKTVSNFVYLARSGFYEGLTWDKVVPDALIQTGDPNSYNGVSPDDAGYTIPDEPVADLDYTYGAVGMANTGRPDSGGSQFFIVTHAFQDAAAGRPKALDIEPRYTIFGAVRPRFYGSLQNIARQDITRSEDPLLDSRPVAPIYVEKIEITGTKR